MKKVFIFTLIIGLTFTLVGINKAFAISTLGSSKVIILGFKRKSIR